MKYNQVPLYPNRKQSGPYEKQSGPCAGEHADADRQELAKRVVAARSSRAGRCQEGSRRHELARRVPTARSSRIGRRQEHTPRPPPRAHTQAAAGSSRTGRCQEVARRPLPGGHVQATARSSRGCCQIARSPPVVRSRRRPPPCEIPLPDPMEAVDAVSAAASDVVSSVCGGARHCLRPWSAVGGGWCLREEERSTGMREENGEEERAGTGSGGVQFGLPVGGGGGCGGGAEPTRLCFCGANTARPR
jgi:hypothetical protein